MRTLLRLTATSLIIAQASATDLPFVILDQSAADQITAPNPNIIQTPLNQLQPGTASMVVVQSPAAAALTDAHHQNNAMAQAYQVSVSKGTKPANGHVAPPLPNPAPMADEMIDYDHNSNSAQAWATMSELGVPYLSLHVDGLASGKSVASWSARYVVPGSGNRTVYVRFTVPALTIGGRFLDNARNPSWARLRADFLLDGYPAWSIEAVRFNEFHSKQVQQADGNVVTVWTQQVYLEQFGSPIKYLENPETATYYTTGQQITMKLGTFPGGKVLDLMQLFQLEGKLTSGCNPDGDEFACGGVEMKVDWNPNAPPPTFYSQATN